MECYKLIIISERLPLYLFEEIIEVHNTDHE